MRVGLDRVVADLLLAIRGRCFDRAAKRHPSGYRARFAARGAGVPAAARAWIAPAAGARDRAIAVIVFRHPLVRRPRRAGFSRCDRGPTDRAFPCPSDAVRHAGLMGLAFRSLCPLAPRAAGASGSARQGIRRWDLLMASRGSISALSPQADLAGMVPRNPEREVAPLDSFDRKGDSSLAACWWVRALSIEDRGLNPGATAGPRRASLHAGDRACSCCLSAPLAAVISASRRQGWMNRVAAEFVAGFLLAGPSVVPMVSPALAASGSIRADSARLAASGMAPGCSMGLAVPARPRAASRRACSSPLPASCSRGPRVGAPSLRAAPGASRRLLDRADAPPRRRHPDRLVAAIRSCRAKLRILNRVSLRLLASRAIGRRSRALRAHDRGPGLSWHRRGPADPRPVRSGEPPRCARHRDRSASRSVRAAGLRARGVLRGEPRGLRDEHSKEPA